MKSDLKTRHGGKILADALVAQGVKLAFGVPGESYLPVIDGLYDHREELSFVVCRQRSLSAADTSSSFCQRMLSGRSHIWTAPPTSTSHGRSARFGR